VDDHQTTVLAIRLRVFADDRFEIDAVISDQDSALVLSHLEEVGIAQSPEA
jgi:hypothetical protein